MRPRLIRQAEKDDVAWIKGLLEENGLPTVGVDQWYGNFVVAVDETGEPVGVAGFELYNHNGLLRSVVVEKDCRNAGYGQAVVEAVLGNAKKRGVEVVYLFTETAQDYFKRLGFDVVGRDQVDEAVKGSPELTECCSRAAAMCKTV
jgi:amino-acid N-acetyltransferase